MSRVEISVVCPVGPHAGDLEAVHAEFSRAIAESGRTAEFIYVLEGEMEVFVEETRDVLRPGDAIYYDATSKHLVRAHGDKDAKILAVLVS